MIVYVGFTFDGIEEASAEADRIIGDIAQACETMRIGFDADNCWISDVKEEQAS